VASIGLAFLVLNMMGPKEAPPARAAAPQAGVTMQRVLVAGRDLKIGEKVTAQDIGWHAWPPGAINETFITDGEARPIPNAAEAAAGKVLDAVMPDSAALAAVEGAIVREPIFKGEPIVQRKLVKGGEGGFMSVVLEPGMRAVSVPVTVETAAGGFILPNDHVDLVLNQKVKIKNDEASDVTVAKTVMENVRVLAIDQNTEPEKDARAIVGAVATLEIPEDDVSTVTAAKSQGELMLVLRAYSDAVGGPRRGVAALLGSDVVRVYRSNQPSEVRVAR
jgi:pilus assembly protein CpaB